MDLEIKAEMKESMCGEIIGLVLYLIDKKLSRTVDEMRSSLQSLGNKKVLAQAKYQCIGVADVCVV